MEAQDHGGEDNERPLLVATRKSLETFDDDVRYLWSCSDLPVYENPPSALDFLRNHVAVSRPCIIRNSILRRPTSPRKPDRGTSGGGHGSIRNRGGAVPLTMTLDDLVRLFPEADSDVGTDAEASSTPPSPPLPPLCVDVTPDGHGDCLRRVTVPRRGKSPDSTNTREEEEDRVFVKPLETKMRLSEFCRRLRNGRSKRQRQLQQYCYENDRESVLDRMFSGSSSSSSSPRTACSQDSLQGGRCGNDDESLFEDCVLYYSRQNDCLREELSPLWNLKRSSMDHRGGDDDGCDGEEDDSFVFPRSFPWAEEAFFGQQASLGAGSSSGGGVGPDAVNLWMGDERAVSAMHKDHYENLFYVLSGEKVFGLCPPSDAPFLYEREVLSGRFQVTSGDDDADEEGDSLRRRRGRRWSVVLDREEDDGGPDGEGAATRYAKVHWIATDLFGARSDRADEDEDEGFPLSKHAHPTTVTVRAGELLYLPSLWFHRVTQTRETVGINYWYDMNFESPLWCYFHLLQQLRPFREARVTDNSNDDDDGE